MKKKIYTHVYTYICIHHINIDIYISYAKTVIHIYTNIYLHIYLSFIGHIDISSTHYENKKNCIYFESAIASYTVKYVHL
jgi:hypothetical protein